METKTAFLILGVIEFILALLLAFEISGPADLIAVVAAFLFGVVLTGSAFYLLILETNKKKRKNDENKRP